MEFSTPMATPLKYYFAFFLPLASATHDMHAPSHLHCLLLRAGRSCTGSNIPSRRRTDSVPSTQGARTTACGAS
eukprot:4873184-Pleurochrysis_carterae.AAC.3